MRVSMLSETCSPPNVSAPRSHMMMAAGSMKRQATRMVCAAAEKVAVPVAAGATQTAEAVLDNPTNQKVSFVSLGCPKNVVDGEVILGDLYKSGFEVTQEHEDADAIVINTCAFVQDAKSESIEAIMVGGVAVFTQNYGCD
eukprot:871099-Pelagomonas_calceolata.AAC.8